MPGSDLQSQLDQQTPQQQSQYDQTLKKIIDGKDNVLVTGSFALSATGDGKASIQLPELPKDVYWQLSPVAADHRGKVATTGSSGSTAIQVATEEAPNTNLATLTIANTDTDDTFVDMASVLRTLLPGGQKLLLHVDSLATGVAGPATIEMVFRAVADHASTRIVDLQ